MIHVTKSFLPPIEEYQAILQRAWDDNWLTNRGILVKELENKLESYLQVPNVLVMANGTLPLQIAIKTLGLKNEIITTPFSYVASTSSIVWEGCTPVFVDIHPEYLTIDETQIEQAITPKTTAILATHVFGNPCNVEAIEIIAKKHKLKVIYDAAHCFGVTYKGQSIFSYGEVSTCSFHATKLFHTGEGGAIFTNDNQLYFELYNQHNFGHDGPEAFHGLGINAKMSELQAAMGLSILPYIFKIIEKRKAIVDVYIDKLTKVEGLQLLKIREGTRWNYSYFPIIFNSEEKLLTIKELLEKNGVFPRRYFFPSLTKLPYIVKNHDTFIANHIATRIMCLPIFHDFEEKDQIRIIELIKSAL